MADVSRTKKNAGIALALVIGTSAFAFGGYELYKYRKIAAGPTVQGRATGWDTSVARGRTRYKVKYAFEHDGARYTGGWATVPKDTSDATRAGAPLPVRVAGGNPDWHLPEAAIPDAKVGAGLTLATGALVIAFGVIAGAFSRAAKSPAPTPVAQDGNFPKDPPPGSP